MLTAAISDLGCGLQTNIANSINNYNASDVIAHVTYDCHSGYRFDDMTMTATVLCVDGQCACLPGRCESKSLRNAAFMKKSLTAKS